MWCFWVMCLVHVCVSMHWRFFPVDEKIKEIDQPQTTRNTHPCALVCDNLLFSVVKQCSILPAFVFLLYYNNPPWVLSASPYSQCITVCIALSLLVNFGYRIDCYIWGHKDFSGSYYIHFGWPATSSQPTSWSPALLPRLQTSVTFYWFWRLAAPVCSDKEQDWVCVFVYDCLHVHECERLQEKKKSLLVE